MVLHLITLITRGNMISLVIMPLQCVSPLWINFR